ncbi:serine/arginine-rich splicing factor SC35 isoform X2 [Prosopis cineraria]|uniref:serine/arginine-rich splicing factor SC35 isoform X2 n=2 Tax=Prosopis cineraria TaxID=364024 RepID=UPI0024102315|nr:serine/arginine-rich splicing factor SC35 isoform X2 [Prosopis cineraria]
MERALGGTAPYCGGFSLYTADPDTAMSGSTSCTVYIGRVVDLYIPRDKESEKPKGFAFAEYESEEIADYAVRLFSGLVTLYNRTLKFAISGQDKPTPNGSAVATPSSNSSHRSRPHPAPMNSTEISQHSARISTPSRISDYPVNYSRVTHRVVDQTSEYGSLSSGNNYEYSRRVFGPTLDSISRYRSRRYDTSNPISYPSY